MLLNSQWITENKIKEESKKYQEAKNNRNTII